MRALRSCYPVRGVLNKWQLSLQIALNKNENKKIQSFLRILQSAFLKAFQQEPTVHLGVSNKDEAYSAEIAFLCAPVFSLRITYDFSEYQFAYYFSLCQWFSQKDVYTLFNWYQNSFLWLNLKMKSRVACRQHCSVFDLLVLGLILVPPIRLCLLSGHLNPYSYHTHLLQAL